VLTDFLQIALLNQSANQKESTYQK